MERRLYGGGRAGLHTSRRWGQAYGDGIPGCSVARS
jgi:hypothetical protein